MTPQLLSKSPEKGHQHVDRREAGSNSAQSFQGGLHPIHQLQRTLGNRLVAQLIQANRLTPEGTIVGLQPKLIVGGADDQHEQEADRVARQVMNTPDAVATASAGPAPSLGRAQSQTPMSKSVAASIAPIVQRQMATEEEEEKEERIQRKSAGALSGPFEAGADVQSQLNLSKGGGSALPDSIRAYMEPRFGVDFSKVHVHTGSDALQMNRAVGAQAFTHGSDIYFGAGHSPTNLELTAHELTHVVQQTGGVGLPTRIVGQRSLARTEPAIQRAAETLSVTRIEEKESEPTSALPIRTGEPPSKGSSVAPKQAAEAQKASAPPGKKETKVPAAVKEAGSMDTAPAAPGDKETLPSPATGKAPDSPEEDSSYQAVVNQVEGKAKNQKKPVKKPANKQVETQLAANLTPEETAKQNAYDKHLTELAKIQPELTVEKFMGEFRATTAKFAEKLPSHKEQHGTVPTAVELGVAKARATQDLANQRNAHSQPLRTEAAKSASDYQNIGPPEAKTYELTVDPPGSIPDLPHAKAAAPKPRTDPEISLDDQSRSLDDALVNHNVNGQRLNIDEGSLALPISGETTFAEAGEAKHKAQDEIAKAKPRYRDVESAVVGKSQDDVQGLVNAGLQGQHELRSTSFKEVLSSQKSHAGTIESQKRTVFTKFEEIYNETKTNVNAELAKLNSIEQDFQNILSEAEKSFNSWVRNDLEYIYTPGFFDYSDWKDRHEAEIKAEFETQQRLTGGDGWAKQAAYAKALKIVRDRSADLLFANARTVFIGEVNREVEAKIATKVVAALNAAKKHIQDGKDKVNRAFAALSPKEQEEATNVLQAVTGKFEQLEESVEDRKREIIADMAKTYNQSVGKLKASFDAIKKDVLTSWLEKAWNKLKAVVNAIIEFATRIAELLGRLIGLVADIIASPRSFFNNLVTGIKQGFSTFAEQIDRYLATAFFDWLRGSSGLAIQMPKDWNPQGIFSLFTQLLNLSTETIWERMGVIYGKTIVNTFRRGEVLLDKGLEIFAIIKNEGLGGLWDHIKESLGNILEETLAMIKETVLYAAIKKVILEIGKLLVPGGGFIAIAEKIIRLLQFIAEARDKILDLIESFVDSVEMAVKGNVPGIVKHITGALTKFITIALDFLVNFFGLGALKDKVTRFIERMRKPIIAGIDWVLEKFKPLVMKAARFVEKGKEKLMEAGKAVVQVGVPQDPQERLSLAARASVSAARRLTGRVTRALLNPILASIRVRYGLRALQPYEKGGTWWVKASANPELDQDLGVTAEALTAPAAAAVATRPTLHIPFTMSGVGHRLTFDRKRSGDVEILMASERRLPLSDEFRTAHTALDNLRRYVDTIQDPDVKELFENEFGTALSTLPSELVGEFKRIYDGYFPRRDEGEALPPDLSPEQRLKAKTQVEPFIEKGTQLTNRIKEWGNKYNIEGLSADDIDKTVEKKGNDLWTKAWQATNKRILDILRQHSFVSKRLFGRPDEVSPVQIRGSVEKKFRGDPKARTRFDERDFDVDMYVVNERAFNQALALGAEERGGKIFPQPVVRNLQILNDNVQRDLVDAFPNVARIGTSNVVLRKERPNY
jgi:hypothetical protein